VADDRPIDRAIEALADGDAVDWDALESSGLSDEEREWVNCLRVIGGVANLHRTTSDDGDAEAKAAPWQNEDAVAALPIDDGAAPGGGGGIWGRYRLVEKVGEGTFGRVYRAWDPELERELAIKILHRRVADARLKERLLSEGRALARIQHPNVVRVLGVESHEDQVGLCMEFVRGETLDHALRTSGPLSAREAALVGEDVCRALAAVHLAGFVHRDVKARNVMREQAGRIVLMDFGTGRATDRTGDAGVEGTPLYMAPEVLAGQPASPCSDVYSVGVLLYHLVTGHYPVEGRTLDELLAAHREGRRRLLSERRPELPLPFIQVVDRALTSDPALRCSSAGALLEALGAIESEQRTARTAARFAAVIVALPLLAGVLGFLATSAFNLTLGRTPPFDHESPAVWLQIGFNAVVAPVLYLGAMLVGIWVVRFAVRVAALSPPVDRLITRIRARIRHMLAQLNLDDPVAFGQAVTTLGVLALGAVVWWYADLLVACVTMTISDTPDPNRLFPLRPGHDGATYRLCLDVLILILAAAIVRIRTLTRRRSTAGTGALVPVAALLGLIVVMSATPYRLLYKNQAERIDFAGERCYVLGEQRPLELVYCPDRKPPRNQVIMAGDPSARRVGIVESIFTPRERSD
jgi:hypothetical protein